MSEYLDLKVIETAGDWDADGPRNYPDGALIFWQSPPPESWLHCAAARIVWVPMWDDLPSRESGFWERLPQELRVVALSDGVEELAHMAGLRVFSARFYPDPADYAPVDWSQGRIAYYWNRRGLVSPEFLRKFCEVARISTLLFRPDLDPVANNAYQLTLPPVLGKTRVETLGWFDTPQAYRATTERANIVIAPRESEGVGMVVLDAMARGAAVVAYDGPSMNEYIESGTNGTLLRRFGQGSSYALCARMLLAFRSLTRHLNGNQIPVFHNITEFQSWQAIGHVDFESLGKAAQIAYREGFRSWNAALPRIAEFLCEGEWGGKRNGEPKK